MRHILPTALLKSMTEEQMQAFEIISPQRPDNLICTQTKTDSIIPRMNRVEEALKHQGRPETTETKYARTKAEKMTAQDDEKASQVSELYYKLVY